MNNSNYFWRNKKCLEKFPCYLLLITVLALVFRVSMQYSNHYAWTTQSSSSTQLPAGSVQINGAGSTFILPVITEWIYAYQYIDPSAVTLNYQGIGSGGGKKAIIDNTVDFAGSDSVVKRG